MITLDDCIEFCELPPAAVEKIADTEQLPMVVACAYGYGRAVSSIGDKHPSPCSPGLQTRLA